MNLRTNDSPHHRHNPRIEEGQVYVEYSHLGVLANKEQHVEAMVCFLATGKDSPKDRKEFYNATKDSLRKWGILGMAARAKKLQPKHGQAAEKLVNAYIA